MSKRDRITLTVTLSKDIRTFIEQRTSAGNYDSPGAFVEECIREMLEREEKSRLDQLLIEGVESGPSIPVTAGLKRRLLADLDRRSKARRAGTKAKLGRGAA